MESSSSSHSLSLLSERIIVVGFGGTCLDILAVVANFPKPDDKIRSKTTKIQGGGDAANTLTCASRLGLKPRLISKISNDMQGMRVLKELQVDGVDTSFLVVAEHGETPFSYVIVDQQTNTRTCIFTPGYPRMKPDDICPRKLQEAVRGASIVYFDGRLTDAALVVAQEAACKNIPILVDAEKKRQGLDDILVLATYAVCAAKFPQSWTGAASVGKSLVSMLLSLPKLEFVIVTLGAEGCIMLERTEEDVSPAEEVDVDSLLLSLHQTKEDNMAAPMCIPSEVMNLCAKGIGTVQGRLYLGTAEKIPHSELVDTTGAGDAFIGAILYALCTNMTPEKMLPFAAKVAAEGCRALGARTGLPYISDPCLAPFLFDGMSTQLP